MISLRSKITQAVLGHFMLNETSEMYISEMSRKFNCESGNLTRKLIELEQVGILKSEQKGQQRYFSLNRSFPLLSQYKKIILQTSGFEHLLKQTLDKVPGIYKAMIFGSYASGKMDSLSDIDILVVGEHETIKLQREIGALQKKAERQVNVISMSKEEFNEKKQKDPFLKDVLSKKTVIVK